MADPTVEAPVIESPGAEEAHSIPGKTSFQDAFLKALETDPDAPKPPAEKPEPKPDKPPTATPKVETAKPKQREVPAQLFKKPAEPEKKEEPAPVSEIDKIAEPKFHDAKDRAGWGALKGKAKEYERKVGELESKIKEVEARGGDTKTLETRLSELEKENSELSDIVMKARAESHPKHRAKYIDGRANLINKAKTIIEESGGDPKAVETALNLQGKPRVDALREVAGELDNFQAGRLGKVIDELTSLDEEANAKVADSGKYWQELQRQDQERTQKEQQAFQREARTNFDAAVKRLTSELEVLNKAEGVDWWNEQGDAIVKNAREFYEGNTDLGSAAEAAIQAQAAPVYRDLYLKEREHAETLATKVAEMEKELKSIYETSPGLTGRPASESGKKKSFTERFSEEYQPG